MATVSLLGLSGDGVMDAFVLAFRIPNLFRRLFGEGALAAAYLPVLTEELERDRPRAWQFASVGLRCWPRCWPESWCSAKEDAAGRVVLGWRAADHAVVGTFGRAAAVPVAGLPGSSTLGDAAGFGPLWLPGLAPPC